MQQQIFSLSGTETEIKLRISDYTEILYWGEAIAAHSDNEEQTLSRAIPYGRLDTDIPMTLSPELGRGLFSSPGLEGHRNGQHWAPVFINQSVVQSGDTLTITGEDKLAGLQLVSELVMDKNDVVRVRHTLVNLQQGPYSVNRLACTLPLPERAKELLTYYGRWVNEFQQTRTLLSQGGYQQENRRGRTSHEHYPALIAGTTAFGEMSGETWGFHLAWSGNHRMRVDVKADGRRFMQAEALYLPGEIVLEQNERISTPWLYATYSAAGLNKMSHHFHQHVRETILGDRIAAKSRPIHLNTWEGIYFDHDPVYIMDMASQSAEMGVERFIIDDGWFRNRNGDKAALGDWYLDNDKYPQGLGGIVDHVNKLGMEFGLWFEPEMINKDSDLYRTHPDWLLAVDGYEQPTGRNQYAIDLQNNEAFNYLFERLDHFLSTYNIAYIKWDMNREIVQPGHNGIASGHRQVERYYQLVDKLMAKHPHVEIESCAAGGGRIDYEVLKRTCRFWASDNNDAFERQQIQRGMSYFFPPEVMGSHIGAKHCHSTRRTHDINFRGLTALFGHMGIELDPVKESEEEKQGFIKYIKLHKQLRSLLHTGKTLRLTTDDEAHLAHGVVAQDQNQAVVMIAQTAMPTNSLSSTLRIPGLAKDKQYRITLLDRPENLHDIVNRQPLWTEETLAASGEWLEKAGIAVPVMDPETAVLVELKVL